MQNIRKPNGKEGEKVLDNMNKNHTPMALWALQHTPIKEEDTVIDVGCGGGINLQRYSKIAQKGKIIGVDYSTTSVKKSIEFNQEEVDNGKISVIEAGVVDIPLNDSIADVITASATIYYWPEIIKAFKEKSKEPLLGFIFILFFSFIISSLFSFSQFFKYCSLI